MNVNVVSDTLGNSVRQPIGDPNRRFSMSIPKVAPKGFVVIDTETTGATDRSRIIELGMVFMSPRGTQQKTFSTLLFGDGNVGEWYVKRVHRIRQSQLDGAPQFKDIASDFLASLNGRIIFAHNASFDRKRLNHELKIARRRQLREMGCTIELGQYLGYGRLSLDKAVEKFGLFRQLSHYALHDAFVTSQLLRHYICENPEGVAQYLDELK